MPYEKYIGHPAQLFGVEEHRLVGGRGEGMRLFQVRNGRGLEFTVSADRCADISRLSLHGTNLNYFSPCGYVGPQYYDKDDFGFLKSFTCGFLTTCGLSTIGTPSVDQGERFPLHGGIGNAPAEHVRYEIGKEEIVIRATVRDASIFGRKLVLERTLRCSLANNSIALTDAVRNEGSAKEPIMLLYHVNLGYPLLDENAELRIPSERVEPRDERAKEGLGEWSKIDPPKAGFLEQCYYHHFKGDSGLAKVFNPKVRRGLALRFDTRSLGSFVQWKMLGERDYVLGLEPCSARIEGRNVAREKGELDFLEPGEERTFSLGAEFFDERKDWAAAE
jgi:hypothetical protein